jgi:hypothetical protein
MRDNRSVNTICDRPGFILSPPPCGSPDKRIETLRFLGSAGDNAAIPIAGKRSEVTFPEKIISRANRSLRR